MQKILLPILLGSLMAGCGKEASNTSSNVTSGSMQVSGSRGISKTLSATQELIASIKNQDTIIVKTILAYDYCDPNALSLEGERPIVLASRLGKTDIVEELIKAGSDVNLSDHEGKFALIEATKFNHFGIVKTLLPHLEDLNIVNDDQENALIIAIEKNNQNISNLLIKAGINTEMKNQRGQTPLDLAKSRDLKSTVQLLTDVSSIRQKGLQQNILLQFIEGGQFESLEYAANFFNLKEYLNGANYISAVLNSNDPINRSKILRLLMRNNLSPNGEPLDTALPVIEATLRNDLFTLRLLFQFGADLNVVDKNGMTALTYAAKSLDLQIVNYLIANGANTEYEYNYQGTVFMRNSCSFIPRVRKPTTETRELLKKIKEKMDC
jgi:uncharacterized protein